MKPKREDENTNVYSSNEQTEAVSDVNWTLLTTITLTLANPFNLGIANSISNGTSTTQFDKLLLQAEQAEIQAAFTATPTTGTAPLTVQFDAGTSIGDNLSYEWDFGDGTTASGQEVEHLYEKPNSYVVKLTISNTNSTNSVVDVVTVQSVANGDTYTMQPDGVIVHPEGLILGTNQGLLTAATNFNIKVIDTPDNWPPSPPSNSLLPNEVAIGSFYEISSSNIMTTRRRPDTADDGVWIGLPIPDGIDPFRVGVRLYTPKSRIPSHLPSPIWKVMDSYSFYDSDRHMIFIHYAFYTTGDETIKIVLTDTGIPVEPEIYKLPFFNYPWDKSISPLSNNNSSFKIKCHELFKITQPPSQSCDNLKAEIEQAFNDALQFFERHHIASASRETYIAKNANGQL